MLNGFVVIAAGAADVQSKIQDFFVYVALPLAAIVVVLALCGGKLAKVGMILLGGVIAAGLVFASASSIESVGAKAWALLAGLI